MTRVDYDRSLWRAYRAGRALSEDTGRLWMDAIARHLGGTRSGLTVLDLGAGTGRFAVLLADAFDARVVAVEPSEKMRVEAERYSAHPRVDHRAGAAETIPAADTEFDFAFLSMIIHHVGDVVACARELYRVVKPGGLVFIRNVFSGRLDGVPHYAFFPRHAPSTRGACRRSRQYGRPSSRRDSSSRPSIRWCRRSTRASPPTTSESSSERCRRSR